MQWFISEDFLLQSEVARELYREYAQPEPIFDYHCHLPPDQLAENKTFRNLYEIWLAGDHYKWRAMRSNRVPEKYCTGDPSDLDNFLPCPCPVPTPPQIPLSHGTHLELRRFLGIQRFLKKTTPREFGDKANATLAALPAPRILESTRAGVVSTPDDPTDPLEQHRR